MKFIIFLCIFALTKAQMRAPDLDVVGKAELGKLPEKASDPTYRDYVETSNLKLLLRLARRLAATGLHELVPFDPFTSTNETFDLPGIPEVEGYVTLSDVKVTGIKEYEFPELLLQSQSLVDEDQKLLTFKNTIPELQFSGKIKGEIVYLNIKTNMELSWRGYSKGITNTGKLGLSKKFNPVAKPKYQIDSYSIETDIEELQIDFLPQGIGNRARMPLIQSTMGDVIASIVSAVVRNELNKVLNGLSADQVDAFLRTGVPDSIVIELNDIDGKSNSGELPVASSDPDDVDLIESSNLQTIIELTRRVASVGILDIPIFEPYNAGSLEPLKLGKGISVILEPSNVVVHGLQLFNHPSLTLQSHNLSLRNAKLLKFEEVFRELSFTANIKMNWGVLTSCKVSGIARNVVNNGSLGIELVPAEHSNNIGRLDYKVTAFDLENRISHLKLEITDIKTVRNYIPTMAIWHDDTVQVVADRLSHAVGKAAQKQFNAILEGLRPRQVEAFLLGDPLQLPRMASRMI